MLNYWNMKKLFVVECFFCYELDKNKKNDLKRMCMVHNLFLISKIVESIFGGYIKIKNNDRVWCHKVATQLRWGDFDQDMNCVYVSQVSKTADDVMIEMMKEKLMTSGRAKWMTSGRVKWMISSFDLVLDGWWERNGAFRMRERWRRNRWKVPTNTSTLHNI